MNQQDIRTLKILEEIDNEQNPSQRDIAEKLNISLGLANSFIKRLARKGYFKIKTIPSNRVKYLLTPKGAAEKMQLTYAYVQYSYNFYKNARQKFRVMFDTLESEGIKKIAFYGASDIAEIAFLSLQETSIQLVNIFDEEKNGGLFCGFTIESTERLSDFTYEKLIYTDEKPIGEFFDRLEGKNISKEKIVLIR
jgi:DNA-binding MarR family transcriptional regulator